MWNLSPFPDRAGGGIPGTESLGFGGVGGKACFDDTAVALAHAPPEPVTVGGAAKHPDFEQTVRLRALLDAVGVIHFALSPFETATDTGG